MKYYIELNIEIRHFIHSEVYYYNDCKEFVDNCERAAEYETWNVEDITKEAEKILKNYDLYSVKKAYVDIWYMNNEGVSETVDYIDININKLIDKLEVENE